MKERLDVLLVKRGLAVSREKAKAVIMSGCVYVENQKEDKAGSMFADTANIEVRGNTLKYVSRGGLKLEKAMNNFGVSLQDNICMDVGSSTGGFTDCMLQNGAVKVYAIDVGHGQLDWKFRNVYRVVCMERTNIRYVTPDDLQEPADFSSIDVSFISLTKVLLPGSLPLLMSTMKVNIGLCLVGVIIGEFLSAKAGLGYLITYASQTFEMTKLMSALIMLCLLSCVLYQAVGMLEKQFLKQ